ncbi:MAG: hypothetical protein V4653_03575 [Pseudomonadota bacterium]
MNFPQTPILLFLLSGARYEAGASAASLRRLQSQSHNNVLVLASK